ncbi:MAG: hypothetical protein H6843_07585 [Rhodospirillaceae bacterium]|nr:hypothetical protein [Rhodospirillaceae bacterium]
MMDAQTGHLAGANLDAVMESAVGEANALAEAALMIQNAETDQEIGDALRRTFQLWAGLRAAADWRRDWPEPLTAGVRDLADFVLSTILGAERGEMTVAKLTTLATINLRIAMGILEAQIRALLGDDAFARWEADGRPMGPDMEAWMQRAAAPVTH